MTEWKKCKLGDVADRIGMGPFGSNIKVSTFVDEGIPVISGTHLRGIRLEDKGYDFITVEHANKLQSANVYRGDVIFTHAGNIGQVAFIPTNSKFERYIISQRQFYLRCRKDALTPEFLTYYFKSNEGQYQLLANANQTGVPSLAQPVSYLKTIDIVLPPLPEQCAIAGVLSSLDDKIDLLQRQNKTLEGMAEALWWKMFVEDGTNSKIVNLGEIIDIHDSKRIPLSSMQREKMKDGVLYPYYGAATIMDYINQYIFDGEFLLLGEDGTVETDDGYPVLQLATGKFWVNNHTHVLQAKKPFSNFLLYIVLRNTPISHIVTGAVQPKINQENLKSLEISSAKDIIVDELSTVADNFWQKIQANNLQLLTLSRLRDTLLPKLMSGEVRVNN